MMWVKCELILLSLDIVLISVQDRCTVCAECTTGMEIILAVPDGTLGDVGQGEARLVRLEIVLVLTQDRCVACAERAIVLEVIFGRTR